MTWTDEELVAKSISGDADSFNELILQMGASHLRPRVPARSVAKRMRETCARRRFSGRSVRLPGFRGQAEVLIVAVSDRAEPVPRLGAA